MRVGTETASFQFYLASQECQFFSSPPVNAFGLSVGRLGERETTISRVGGHHLSREGRQLGFPPPTE